MGPQARAFLDSEGGAWLDRNKGYLPVKNDPVAEAIASAGIVPQKILEIGCANGWRLVELQKRFKCECHGVDPGLHGIMNLDSSTLYRGVANNLFMFNPENFDMVIYGFCLYLCDPEDYFDIALEGNRVLADGGHLVIYDFYAEHPSRTPYKHKAGIYARRMRWQELWLGHPAYSIKLNTVIKMKNEERCVVILKKNMINAFPVLK